MTSPASLLIVDRSIRIVDFDGQQIDKHAPGAPATHVRP